jgi:hypothetical protein
MKIILNFSVFAVEVFPQLVKLVSRLFIFSLDFFEFSFNCCENVLFIRNFHLLQNLQKKILNLI